tara:strand:+ start:1190 stop:1528 length:339 start_codon:yes stop_codon:yes gene_type:complete
MAVYTSNLTINTGTTFSQVFTLENVETNSATDLTGFTAAAQMRKHADAIAFTNFTAQIINPTAGKIRVGLTTSQTSTLKPGRHVYDVLVTDTSGEVTRVLEGNVLVRQGVTR